MFQRHVLVLKPQRHTASYLIVVLRLCQVTSGGICITSGNREYESAILPNRMWTEAFLSLFSTPVGTGSIICGGVM